jgi:hypothetical protein
VSSKFILLIFLFFSFQAFSEPKIHLPNDWTIKDQKKDFVVYANSKDPNKTVTVIWAETPTESKINSSNYKSEVQKMEKTRSKMNSLLGLENWQVEKSNLQSDKSRKVLSLQGSYVTEGEKYRFWEKQTFRQNKYQQVKIEGPQKGEPSKEELEKLFNSIEVD